MGKKIIISHRYGFFYWWSILSIPMIVFIIIRGTGFLYYLKLKNSQIEVPVDVGVELLRNKEIGVFVSNYGEDLPADNERVIQAPYSHYDSFYAELLNIRSPWRKSQWFFVYGKPEKSSALVESEQIESFIRTYYNPRYELFVTKEGEILIDCGHLLYWRKPRKIKETKFVCFISNPAYKHRVVISKEWTLIIT